MSKKIKVIIAEDIDIIRENYKEMLSCDDEIEIVAAAPTGRKAIEAFKKHGADIILMDIEMETPTAGIVSASEIFKLSDEVKIIFLSVREDEKTIISSMATGAVDYMVKSDDAQRIISHIKNAYNDKVEMDAKIQNYMRNEFLRLSQNSSNIISYTKKIASLTQSEREIIKLLLQNKKINEIAKIRCVEPVTIKTQTSNLLKKFGVKRTKEIVRQIEELNLTELFI